MADFKVTYIFEGSNRGWTESYILRSPNNDHTKQEAAVTTLAKARANCLSTPCFIKGYRISLEGSGPDALLSYDQFKPGEANLGNGVVAKLDDAADPDQALLIRCSNATQSKHRFIYLRGIPDNIEITHGKYDKKVLWQRVLAEFLRQLTSGVWGWMGVDPA